MTEERARAFQASGQYFGSTVLLGETGRRRSMRESAFLELSSGQQKPFRPHFSAYINKKCLLAVYMGNILFLFISLPACHRKIKWAKILGTVFHSRLAACCLNPEAVWLDHQSNGTNISNLFCLTSDALSSASSCSSPHAPLSREKKQKSRIVVSKQTALGGPRQRPA